MDFIAIKPLDRVNVGSEQIELRLGARELMEREIKFDRASFVRLMAQIEFVELVDDEKIDIRQVDPLADALLRQHIDIRRFQVCRLRRVRNDMNPVPETADEALPSLVDQGQGRHHDDDLLEPPQRDHGIDQQALAYAG